MVFSNPREGQETKPASLLLLYQKVKVERKGAYKIPSLSNEHEMMKIFQEALHAPTY